MDSLGPIPELAEEFQVSPNFMEKRLKFRNQYFKEGRQTSERKNMRRIEEIKIKLEELKPMLKEKFKVESIGIFGSYIRGEEKRGSDLDVLVEFEESARLSLLGFIGLENYLSEELGVKVDLVEKSTLKPRIGKHILEEVVYV